MVMFVSGGYPNSKTVEVINNDGTSLCNLKKKSQLPGPGRGYHTMDGGVVCGGLNNLRSCINFNVDNGKWANYSAELVYERVEHSSWKRPDGQIWLMGGAGSNYYADTRSELVSSTQSVESYNLYNEVKLSCTIQFTDFVVVTGGVENQKYVYAYGPSSYLYSLPYLLNGRYAHGCGQFVNNDENIVYIVTGGYDTYDILSSTEILIKGQSSWALAGSLPSSRAGLKGISLGNNVFMTGGSEGGGISNEILMLNKESMIWTKTGYMQEERYHHAISALPYDDLEPHCFFG